MSATKPTMVTLIAAFTIDGRAVDSLLAMVAHSFYWP